MKYEELSLGELLELLPAELELRKVEVHLVDDNETSISFSEKKHTFNLNISKRTAEDLEMYEGDNIAKLFPKGAWVIMYELTGFEGRAAAYPIRTFDTLNPLMREEILKLDEDDLLSCGEGLLGVDLKKLVIELISWLNNNNICQC